MFQPAPLCPRSRPAVLHVGGSVLCARWGERRVRTAVWLWIGWCVSIGVLAVAGLVPIAFAAEAPHGPRTARVTRIDSPPKIDGRLDEPFWKELSPIGAFVQTDPVQGAAPSERTEIRLAYDSHDLYLGIRLYDREPQKLIAKQMVIDTDMTSDDRINLILDTFHDSRNAYFFQINPAGTRSDALIENNQNFRRDWNGIWYAKVRVDEEGWVAEIAIPFKTVSLAAGQEHWGFEAERIIRRRNEKMRWANPSNNRTVIDVAGIGVIDGLHDIDATGIDLKPNLALGRDWQSIQDPGVPERTRANLIAEPSGDVFYKFHPSIVATLTANTNFLESSPDELRTELTRFPPVFPEKRDFFLQDAGIFEFGGLRGNGIPFFSRRVGRRDGQPLDIDAGLKLTGRLGKLSFGGLGVTLPDQKGMNRTNLAVARAQYGVLGESAVGVVGTYGDPNDGGANGLIGADFQYSNSDIGGGRILRGSAFAMKSFSRGGGSDDYALGARLVLPNDKYNVRLSYTQIGEDFDPRLGFVNRPGIHRYEASGRRRWRPGGWLRTVDSALAGDFVFDRSHRLESARVSLTAIDLHNQAGDGLRLQYNWQQERLRRAPFEIDPGVVIPLGRYDFNRFGVRVASANSRPVSGSAEVIWGSFYSGELLQAIATLGLRPTRYVFVGLEYEQDDGDLGEGRFVKRLARLKLNLAFTPQIAWTNVLQYERYGRLMDLSSILRWEIDPGNDLYLIVGQAWNEERRGRFRPTRSIQAAKLFWTLRF